MLRPIHAIAAALIGLAVVATGAQAADAPVKRSLCVFDPVGANGFIVQQFQNYVIQARNWGVAFTIHPYTDEGVAASDFKAGRCDAVTMTGIRAIQFVKFSGSLDMVGALQTYAQEHTALQVMASPKAASLMQSGNYEIAGIVPGGKVFLFSSHKSYLDSLAAAAGKKIAVMGFDKQASTVANVAGASPVSATIATFGPMFNNHSVDMAYAPAFAYNALELYKGLGTQGGIADFVLGMLSLQMVVHKDSFPADFAQQSRSWVFNNSWDTALARIRESDNGIPSKYWVKISGDRETKYRAQLVQVRQRLWQENWYNHRMQHLLKKIRCSDNAALPECSQDTEGGPVH